MCIAAMVSRGTGRSPFGGTGGATAAFSSEAALRRLLPEASGTVIEIGPGTGASLPYYDRDRVDRLIGIEPDAARRGAARRLAATAGFPVDILDERAERLPLARGSADTVVSAYALCSVVGLDAALAEIRRVLRPMGRLLFLEHGRAGRAVTARWQDRLDPFWAGLAGGCHINRNISRLVENAGFRIEYLDTFRMSPLPGVLGHHYLGIARPR